MKYFSSLYLGFAFSLLLCLFSCSKKNDVNINKNSLLDSIQKTITIGNDTHQIEIFTTTGDFQTGYNTVYFRIKDSKGNLIPNAQIKMNPMMQMMNMAHSCPASETTSLTNETGLYKGFVIFQMASNDSEHWTLQLNYSINGKNYTAEDKIVVKSAPKVRVQSFSSNDGKRYILAMKDPVTPKIGTNTISAYLYQMTNMTTFTPVANVSIKIDPRMPSMGNHSSPNNEQMTYQKDGYYRGNVNLTMTGYWKINLIAINQDGTVLKGETINDTQTTSSLYFEIEF